MRRDKPGVMGNIFNMALYLCKWRDEGVFVTVEIPAED